VPLRGTHLGEEVLDRVLARQQLAVEQARVPVAQHAAEVEHDGAFGLHEKRSQAAWREMPSASPIAAQLTPRPRSASTCSWSTSRVASTAAEDGASVASSASLDSAAKPGKAGAGLPARMRLQSATQASQMYTPGPPISLARSSWCFRQNEQ